MKYVFHDAFVSSSAPKAAKEIIELITKAVGSEMLPTYFPRFFCQLKEMAAEVSSKGKIKLTVEMTQTNNIYGEDIVNRGIYLQRTRNYGSDNVARLFCVSVNSMWAERPVGNLDKFSFQEWDKMKFENAKKGGDQ